MKITNDFRIKQNFTSNNTDAKKKNNEDYNILKESVMEGLLLSGMALADGDLLDISKYKNTSLPKPNSIGDKLLFGTMAVCVLITTIDLIKAIKHYISDKKNT